MLTYLHAFAMTLAQLARHAPAQNALCNNAYLLDFLILLKMFRFFLLFFFCRDSTSGAALDPHPVLLVSLKQRARTGRQPAGGGGGSGRQRQCACDCARWQHTQQRQLAFWVRTLCSQWTHTNKPRCSSCCCERGPAYECCRRPIGRWRLTTQPSEATQSAARYALCRYIKIENRHHQKEKQEKEEKSEQKAEAEEKVILLSAQTPNVLTARVTNNINKAKDISSLIDFSSLFSFFHRKQNCERTGGLGRARQHTESRLSAQSMEPEEVCRLAAARSEPQCRRRRCWWW